MNATIAWITARGLFGRRRFLLLFPLPLILVGLTLLASSSAPDDAAAWGPPILVGLGFAVVLPLVALIVGTGVLGSEIDDGTVVHILTKPLPRREIVLAKLAVAIGVTAVVVCTPMFISGVIADSVRLGWGLAVGSALGVVAYSGLFMALSLLTRRPVLLGLIYVLLWEGLLANLVNTPGVRALSIQQYVVAVADKVAGTPLLEGRVALPVALVMSAVFAIGGTVLAIDRLRSFSLAGETS